MSLMLWLLIIKISSWKVLPVGQTKFILEVHYDFFQAELCRVVYLILFGTTCVVQSPSDRECSTTSAAISISSQNMAHAHITNN